MKKDVLLPILALAAGAVGFALRRVQLATGFEPDTGLAIPGAPAGLALILLCVAVAAVLLFLCRGALRPFDGYDDAMVSHDPGVRAMGNAAGFLLIAAGACIAQEFLVNTWPELSAQAAAARTVGANPMSILLPGTLQTALAVLFCLGGAISLILLTRNSYYGLGRGVRSPATLLPGFGACYWLVLTYRSVSNYPVLQSYVYQLLAVLCVVLALYQYATLAFLKDARPQRALFFSLLAVYFSLVALADAPELWTALLYLSCLLWLTGQSFVLLHNGARLPWPPAPIPPSRDGGDDDE